MVDHAFPSTLRLLKAGEYKRVFDQVDFRIAQRQLLLLARYNDVSHPRLGLIISKKTARRAHDRNRFKRQIREYFRQHRDGLPCVDMVILARSGILDLTSTDYQTLLDTLWRRLVRESAKRSSAASESVVAQNPTTPATDS